MIALNALAAATVNLARAPASSGPPTLSQADCLRRVSRAVAAYGDEPRGLDCEDALRTLLKSRSLYDFEKLRGCKGDVCPKDAVSVLPPVAGGFLKHFRQHIERSSSEIDDMAELPAPYWDPKLKRDPVARDHLLRHLYRLGLCSVRRSTKCRMGLFFVKKKDGMIRMICDSRRPNALHRRPPKARLGGMDSLVELDLSDRTLEEYGGFGEVCSGGITAGAVDVKDSFFQYSVKEVASWFGLGHFVTPEEWDLKPFYDENVGDFVTPQPVERLEVVMEAMSMGWTWALFLCHEGTTSCVTEGRLSRPL